MSDKPEKLPRDAFIDEIYDAATRNKQIYFLAADLGAKALDRFRANCKNQFLHVGICEQNMVDVAAGLAQNGKIVYLYAMAPFVTLRCYEQLKVALAHMDLPATIIGNGVGYSYNDAGPTHYATEDISCMRGLAGIEILTPSDTTSVVATARLSYEKPYLRYVRLDRKFLPDVYAPNDTRFLRDGMVEIEAGKDACIITSGYFVQKARDIRARLAKQGISVAVVDLYRLKPINPKVLGSVLKPYTQVVTYEEHFLSGGLGAAVVEAMADAGIHKDVLRVGVQDRYFCENGGREYIHQLAGIDVETAAARIAEFVQSSTRKTTPSLAST